MKNIFIPPFFLVFCLILIILFYFLIPDFNWIPFPFNLSGIIVAFIGFSIMGKSRDLFRKHQTTLAIEKSSFLITEGVFSKTRNPMYLGMFLLLLGIGICFMNIFSIITAFTFFLLMHFIFIPQEEKLMYEIFDQDYLEYKERVRRWF